jgi:hypothetical protein
MQPATRRGIEIDAPLRYQQRTWVIQRAGWGVFVLLMLAALAGLLGSGPLSTTTVGAPDSLQITYERFARLHAPATIEIRVNGNLVRDDMLTIALSGDAVPGLELSSSMPPPDGTSVVQDGVLLRFRTDSRPGELTVVLHTKPQRVGTLTSRIAVAGGPAHTISQWIYP